MRFSILLLVFSLTVDAAQILKSTGDGKLVVIAHEEKGFWKLEEAVCVFRKGKSLTCGSIAKVTPQGALVKFPAGVKLEKEDTVQRDVDKSQNRKTASTSLAMVKQAGGASSYKFSVGALGWLSYVFPTIGIEKSLGQRFGVALVPSFFGGASGATSLLSIGAYVALNYYHSGGFRGFWVATGPGTFAMTGIIPTVSETKWVLSYLLALGWRWDFGGINVGVAGGGQYLGDPALAAVVVEAIGFQPLVALDVGYRF